MAKKIEWSIIFILHIVLLFWILFVLKSTGQAETINIVLHFSGLSLYGALLIMVSAKLAKRRWQKEQNPS